MHHVDRDTPWDEIWQAMDVLVQQGKVLYVGSSNFAGWHIVQANEAAARRHSLGLVSEQSLYNLNARTIELEVLPACEHYGVGMIPWSPLGGGLLGGVLADRAAGGRRGQRRACRTRIEAMRPQLEQWEKFCAELGHAPADVALAWLLHQPGRHRADHRPAHARPGRRRRWVRSTCSSTPTCWPSSTRSSPARAVLRPRPTPGRAST